MEENFDVENYFLENQERNKCSVCGNYFLYDELQLYKRSVFKNEYICFSCVDVFQD